MWTDTPFRKIFPKREKVGNLGKIFLNFPGTFSYSGKIFLLCGQKFDHQKQENPGKSRKIRDFFSYLGKLFFTVL